MFKFKIIPDLEKNPKIVQFAQTILGKLVIWLLFSSIFWILQFHHNKYFYLAQGFIWDKIFILGLFISFPQYKKKLLVLSSLYWLAIHSFPNWPMPVIKNLATQSQNSNFFLYSSILSIVLILLFTKILKKNVYNVAIVISLITLGLIAIGPTCGGQFFLGILGGSIIILGNFLWYWIFALKDPHFRYWHLLTFMPFWTWTILPIPKGWQYLNQTEAKNNQDLARTQLKGLKLVAWSLVLALVHLLMQTFIYGEQTIIQKVFLIDPKPLVMHIDKAIIFYQTSQELSFTNNWLAVIANFFHSIFYLSIGTHTIVGIIRLCGWQVKRNVYRCFEARSISDFFNRYYYYFKELLVEVFFFPTYFHFFKGHPNLRLFFATFMAAGVGNFLFHFTLDVSAISRLGYWETLQNYQLYALYCLLLSAGLFISQWCRIHGKFQQHLFLVRFRIFLFFMIINTFIESGNISSLGKHLHFILNLFMLDGT